MNEHEERMAHAEFYPAPLKEIVQKYLREMHSQRVIIERLEGELRREQYKGEMLRAKVDQLQIANTMKETQV